MGKKYIYNNKDSLQKVVNLLNDISFALNDKKRTISKSLIPPAVFATVGTSIGGATSYLALYSLGQVDLSGPAIMSALGVIGKFFGVKAGVSIVILSLPVALLGVSGYAVGTKVRDKYLRQERERLYNIAIERQYAMIQELKMESEATKERMEYLTKLNIMLESVIDDLKKDINIESDEI